MPTNDQDARALTYLACRIRKETHGAREWDQAGTCAAVAEMIGHNLAITIERVTRHAADPEAKTPGAIKRPFVPVASTPGPRFPAKAGEDECRSHRGEFASSCRACAADRLAGERHEPSNPAPREESIEAVRAEMAERRAELCRHGAARCAECDRAKEAEQPRGEDRAARDTARETAEEIA